jgi:hypothetical protein
VIDTAPFTDEQWYAMCSAHMSMPVPLARADLTKLFVYDRAWGVFYVPFGCHPAAMSVLLAFHHKSTNVIEVAEKLGLDYSAGTADEWIEVIHGAAFRSSAGRGIQASTARSLNAIERRIFAPYGLQYLLNERHHERFNELGAEEKPSA